MDLRFLDARNIGFVFQILHSEEDNACRFLENLPWGVGFLVSEHFESLVR